MYLGIDPGVSGGMAMLDNSSTPPLLFTTSLKNMSNWDILQWLDKHSMPDNSKLNSCVLMMEQVTGYVSRSKNKETGEDYNRGDRTFQFGKSYGKLDMAIIASGFIEDINYFQVRPQTWQGVMGLKREKGMSQSRWKNVAKKKAIELYPHPTYTGVGREAKITLHTCDAILIATYCMRKVTDTLYAPITPKTTERIEL